VFQSEPNNAYVGESLQYKAGTCSAGSMERSARTKAALTATWTFYEGAWHEGDVRIMGPRTHACWLGSMVFDGARGFEGVMPDLDQHCARVNESASRFFLKPLVSTEAWISLAGEGVKRFAPNAELYIRPMYWAETGPVGGIRHDPESTRWCLCIYEAPLPKPSGCAITLSPFRRPTPDSAPVDAKAGCLYPNNARALIEAQARGFDNCLLRDAIGNVAELATANVFLAKDGVVLTPVPNGTFLDGITRRRVIKLLRSAGTTVMEKALTYADFESADEMFSTGNFAKLSPITRIDGRSLEIGRFFLKARQLYWDFAHG
jgi:branched-chain amino acid aminotransferase